MNSQYGRQLRKEYILGRKTVHRGRQFRREDSSRRKAIQRGRQFWRKGSLERKTVRRFFPHCWASLPPKHHACQQIWVAFFEKRFPSNVSSQHEKTQLSLSTMRSAFLVADTQPYKRLCPSVGPLVRWSRSSCHARVEKRRTRIYDAAIGIVCLWVCWRGVGSVVGVKLGVCLF